MLRRVCCLPSKAGFIYSLLNTWTTSKHFYRTRELYVVWYGRRNLISILKFAFYNSASRIAVSFADFMVIVQQQPEQDCSQTQLTETDYYILALVEL